MARKIKLKRNIFVFKARNVFLMICILIIFTTIFIVLRFNKVVTPKIIEVVDMKLNNMTSLIINKSFDREVINTSLNNLLNIEMDSNGDIKSVNFDLDTAYEIAKNITDRFNQNYDYIERGLWEEIGYNDPDAIANEDGYVLALPIGIASNNVFFANLGPRIPVRIKFVGATLNTIETRLSEYGINNALIEVFVTMSVERQIILPVQFTREKLHYHLPIASKIIVGRIPNWYGGLMARSANLNVPILE